jgi:hypothetical protein
VFQTRELKNDLKLIKLSTLAQNKGLNERVKNTSTTDGKNVRELQDRQQ